MVPVSVAFFHWLILENRQHVCIHKHIRAIEVLPQLPLLLQAFRGYGFIASGYNVSDTFFLPALIILASSSMLIAVARAVLRPYLSFNT